MPAIIIATKVLPAVGRVLVDGKGRTLYVYTPDRRRSVACTPADDCTTAWPPLLAKQGTRTTTGPGVRKGLVGADHSAADGGQVITYNGWPLYYFIGDHMPGQVNGQGQGHDWFAIGPAGKLITAQLSVPSAGMLAGTPRVGR